jgi:hypothetical protein
MNTKTITKTFIFSSTMMILLVFALCKKADNKDEDALALGLILLSQSGKKIVPSATVSKTSVSAAQSVARTAVASNDINLFGKEYTKDFFLAYAKDKLNAKFPYLKLTAISASGGSCSYDSVHSSYSCNATLNGTDKCDRGGNVTFTNVQVNMTGVDAGLVSRDYTLTFNIVINGNISYNKCKTWIDADYDFIDEEVTLNGTSTVDISETLNGTLNIQYTSSGTSLKYNEIYIEKGTVSVKDFSINGQNIGNQDYQVDVNIGVNGSVTPVSMNNQPPIFSFTSTIDNTLNGYVKINSQTVQEFNNKKISGTCTGSYNTSTDESSYNCIFN